MLNANLSSDVVVHFVRVDFVDCKEGGYRDSTSVHGEKGALTCQPVLGSRERHIMGRRVREPNSLVQVLPGTGASLLDLGCSLLSDLLIHGKSDLHVIGELVLIREDDAECRSIFNSLTRPLGLMRLIISQGLKVLFV